MMARRLRRSGAGAALVALAVTMPAAADPLAVAKGSSVVADQVNTLNPRTLPGSTLDYTVLVTNPVGNLVASVRRVVIADPIAATIKLRVRDLGAANSGPVEFVDGNLLNLGLLGSGLAFTFGGLASTQDGLEFFDGTSWDYQPIADAAGYDGRVRAIRVTLVGTQAANSSFRLRYRVAVK